MIQEAYRKFTHVLNDVSWCGVLFFSSNASEKAKEILKEHLSKDAQDAVRLLFSIPVEDIKAFEDYSYISKRSEEVVEQTKHILESKSFIRQTSPEEQTLMKDAYNNIVQIRNILQQEN